MPDEIVKRCAGCGKTPEETGEYDKDNPVEDDRSYNEETGEFVCLTCYILLIPMGLDVGNAEKLIESIKLVMRMKKAREN